MKIYKALFLFYTLALYASDNQDSARVYAHILSNKPFRVDSHAHNYQAAKPFAECSTGAPIVVDNSLESDAQSVLVILEKHIKIIREEWTEYHGPDTQSRVTSTAYLSDYVALTPSQEKFLLQLFVSAQGQSLSVLDAFQKEDRKELLAQALQDTPCHEWEAAINKQLALYACKQSSNRISDLQ